MQNTKSFPNKESAEDAFKLGFSDFVDNINAKTSKAKRKPTYVDNSNEIENECLEC